MSKWLKAARSARASKPDSGPSYAHDNSDNSDNSPQTRPIGTIVAIVTEGKGLLRRAQLAVVPDLSDPEDNRGLRELIKRSRSNWVRLDPRYIEPFNNLSNQVLSNIKLTVLSLRIRRQSQKRPRAKNSLSLLARCT